MKHEIFYPNYPGSVKDCDTSEAAADSVADEAPRLRDKILALIKSSRFGLTCDEVEVKLGLSHQTASARIRELMMLRKILISANRRRTRSGRTARVYL